MIKNHFLIYLWTKKKNAVDAQISTKDETVLLSTYNKF